MPSFVSLDLRRRVVEAYERGGLTYAEVAERFSVGRASVSRWLRRKRESGDVAPLAHGGGQPRKITAKQERLVEKLVLAHPDWTEAEFAAELKRKHDIVASAVTVGRVIRRLGYSVKESRSSRASAIAPTSSANEGPVRELLLQADTHEALGAMGDGGPRVHRVLGVLGTLSPTLRARLTPRHRRPRAARRLRASGGRPRRSASFPRAPRGRGPADRAAPS
ncbi:MAG: transposase [Labilithrix sp.]|nr:transposase [Labilithrix sp.]